MLSGSFYRLNIAIIAVKLQNKWANPFIFFFACFLKYTYQRKGKKPIKSMRFGFLYVNSTRNFFEMVKQIRHTLLIILTVIAFGSSATAQIPDEIIFSLKTGNAAKLASHFSQNVELVILENENVYSKAHAQQVINDFFKKYPPQDFSIIHQGGKEGSNYAIGNLKVDNEKFRVYFLIKSQNGSAFIHQLRIERQSN